MNMPHEQTLAENVSTGNDGAGRPRDCDDCMLVHASFKKNLKKFETIKNNFKSKLFSHPTELLVKKHFMKVY